MVMTEVEYENSRKEDLPVVCELRGKDLNDTPYKIVQIKGLTTSWAIKNNVESGVTTLFASNSFINDEANELVISKGQAIEVSVVGYDVVASSLPKGICTNNFELILESLEVLLKSPQTLRVV